MAGCPNCGAELAPPYQFCSKCGQRIAGAAAYPMPAYYPPPKKDNTALIIVVVVVLVIAVPMILAAVLYVMVSGLMSTGPGTTRPVIALSVTPTLGGADILASGVQPLVQPSNLKFNLEVGSTFGMATSLATPPGTPAPLVVGSATYTVAWQNPSGNGLVSQGDHFAVTYPSGTGAPAAGTTLLFVLIWTDGSTISQISWQA